MMPYFPFFGFPSYRRPYPYYMPYRSLHNANSSRMQPKENPYSPSNFQRKEEQKKGTQNSFCSSTFSNGSTSFIPLAEDKAEEDEQCFEIFGLKLHFDDLLLIALLFFLYQEDVKDSYLYIALILLLLN